MLSALVNEKVQTLLDTEIDSVRIFASSDFNKAYRVQMADKREIFLKVSKQCPADYFAGEALGLDQLRKTAALRIPECYAHDEDFIAIEWLAPAHQKPGFDAKLAKGLAVMHSFESEKFGFAQNTYCGASVQKNGWNENGYAFFADCRLLPQAKRAFDSGFLDNSQRKSVEGLCSRLPELIPKQAPALLHGDLWHGNVLCTKNHVPALIDPACYYGWPEADLAMMQLFGGFNSRLFVSYEEIKPLPSGFAERCSLYNLYHLLNHLNLFGRAYLDDVNNILQRFA
ncbi:MAG: fructosamine kinase family protein [Pseudomonadota bacterium]